MSPSLPPTDRQREPAVVRPRVVVQPDAAPTPLASAVTELLAAAVPARVRLLGPPGAGKRTALGLLRAEFGDRVDLQLLDVDDPTPATARVVVRAVERPAESAADAGPTWTLAPWSDDDCLAYLRAAHPDQAAAAIAAFRHPAPLLDLRRWPRLCRDVLDHLAHLAATSNANHQSATDPLCALAFVLANRLGQRRAVARDHALRTFLPPHARATAVELPAILRADAQPFQSLAVRALLAAEELLRHTADDLVAPFAPRAFPDALIDMAAHLLHADPTLMHRLIELAARPRKQPALLLSVLCAGVPLFRPPHRRLRDLEGARLPGIDLAAADLARATLTEATMHGADLRGADAREAAAIRLQADRLRGAGLRADRIDLTEASLRGADLSRASLAGATLLRTDLAGATCAHADLRQARLVGARLTDCDLTAARLDGADLSHTDLRTAAVRGASLVGARLVGAALAGRDLGGVAAKDADFTRADLAGSSWRSADLRGATFADANLADIDLEGADLRAADLRTAVFQGRRSRRGDSPGEVADDGPRANTLGRGEATARADASEHLRTANLRGCDLRAAKLDGVDLFGVDLRGARLDPMQRDLARRCRAVLDLGT